jgi:hypothetical protein
LPEHLQELVYKPGEEESYFTEDEIKEPDGFRVKTEVVELEE